MALVLALGGCRTPFDPREGSERDAWVEVEGRLLGAAQLSAAREELAPFGQGRFSGEQGTKALLATLVDLELLATRARRAGIFEDPRVNWAEIEAQAQAQARALKERLVPRDAWQADDARLTRYLSETAPELWVPEKRSVWFAAFDNWAQAEQAQVLLVSGALSPQSLENTGITLPQIKDVATFGRFHRLLFDPSLKIGDWLGAPVLRGQKIWVARLQAIEEAQLPDLGDPVLRAAVVDHALRAPQTQALEGYLEQLRERWPLRRSP